MNRFFRILLIIITVLASGISLAQETLTILHLNDTHSSLAAIGPRNSDLTGTQGGIARAASVIGLTKATEPNVLTLHAGDYSIGELFYNMYTGIPELQILKQVGLDAMTVGNHEWDLTPSTLLNALQTAFPDPADAFPLLSANTDLSDPALSYLQNYIFPSTVKQIGNIKVGIFGMTTPAANIESQPSPAVISDDISNIAGTMVTDLYAQDCDVIIFLSHLGLYYDKLIAENVTGINLIVSGHDHYLLNEPLAVSNSAGTTWIVQAGSNYLNIGKVKLLVDDGNVSLVSGEIIPLDENIPEEPSVLALVNSLITDIESTFSIPFFTQQAGYAASFFREVETDLTSAGSHDTPAGNLVTDAFKAFTGTDIAIHACGSMGAPIFQGPLVPADLYRVNGYGFNTTNFLGFRLVTFKIYGAALIGGLEFGLSAIELNDEYLLQCSGMEYTYNSNLDVGSRITSVKINGEDLDPAALYSVTSSEMLVMFLDYLHIPYEELTLLPEEATEFHALMQYVISAGPVLYPKEMGRIVNLNSAVQDLTLKAVGSFKTPEGSLLTNPDYNQHVKFSINADGKNKKDNFNLFFPQLGYNFTSYDLDWIAAGNSHMELRGSGKLNNEGDYGFLVEAYENSSNSKPEIYISIWDKSTEQLMYSNFARFETSGNIKIKKSGEETASQSMVLDYSLEQNYPNPFNPATTLKFSLRDGGKVSLIVYDIIGKQVAEIVNDALPAGTYTYQWDASNLASGIYIYRLKTNQYTDMKKMLLLK